MLIMLDPDILPIKAASQLSMQAIILAMLPCLQLLLALKALNILPILQSLQVGIVLIRLLRAVCILLKFRLLMLGNSLVLIWPVPSPVLLDLLLWQQPLKEWLSDLEVFMSLEVLYHLLNVIILGIPYVIVIGILWRIF